MTRQTSLTDDANQNKANMNWLNSGRDFDTHIYKNSAWRAIKNDAETSQDW